MSGPILDIRDLSVRYGAVNALRGLDLAIEPGEIVFVTGPNGAGKSTLMRTIAGVVRPASGSVTFAGAPTAGAEPEAIVRRGFTLVPEGREVFAGLSVEENLRLGAYLRRDKAEIEADLTFVLDELPALKPRLRHPAGLLSGGQQQMLAIGRALMTRARLIAIDEPSLGLAPRIIDDIYAVLLDLRRKRGLTLLIAEQSFSRAVKVDARLLLLRGGSVVRSGAAREMAEDRSLEHAYFGF